ncbi:MAG: Zn-dependent protease [Phenylobacterium sp.]
MELLKIDYLGQPIRLEGSMAGWQALFCNDELVSQKPASAKSGGQFIHEFDIAPNPPAENSPSKQTPPSVHCQIEVELQWQPFEVRYQLYADGEMMENGKRCYKDIADKTPLELPPPKKRLNLPRLMILAVKLVKSAKVIKLALIGASLVTYAWLFSLTFAVALLISLMFHEFGHVQAMRYFGLKTRGIYLVPFVGGLALGDEKVNTRWQSVVIALAGPAFGMVMSLAYMLVYGLTGEIFFAALAVFNALLNLFNLLPVLPLDGGHVIKHICFSLHGKFWAAICATTAAFLVYLCYQSGSPLLALLLIIGSVEIAFEWQHRHDSHLLPLDHYGQVFSVVWYLTSVICFIGVVWFFAGVGDDMLGLPLKIL